MSLEGKSVVRDQADLIQSTTCKRRPLVSLKEMNDPRFGDHKEVVKIHQRYSNSKPRTVGKTQGYRYRGK